MLVIGGYVASGGENYLTLGNFSDDANTIPVSAGGTGPWAYYYVDDVSVAPLDSGCCSNKVVAAGTSWTFDEPIAVDNCVGCGTSIPVSILTTVTNAHPCSSVITRTWVAQDNCGNTN